MGICVHTHTQPLHVLLAEQHIRPHPALLLRQYPRSCISRTHLVQVDDAQVAPGQAGSGQRGHGVLVGDEVHKLVRHPACASVRKPSLGLNLGLKSSKGRGQA